MTTKSPDSEVGVGTPAKVAFEMATYLLSKDDDTRDEFLELYSKCLKAAQG
jgi:hypothetical protein